MISVKAYVRNPPEEIRLALTVEMSAVEWNKLGGQLQAVQSHPAASLASKIDEVIRRLMATVHGEIDPNASIAERMAAK